MKFQERVLGIFQEQAIVAEWRHGDGNLAQEVQVLQHRALEREWMGGQLKLTTPKVHKLLDKITHTLKCVFSMLQFVEECSGKVYRVC